MEFFKIILYSLWLVILRLKNTAARDFARPVQFVLNRLSYGLQIFPKAKIPG